MLTHRGKPCQQSSVTHRKGGQARGGLLGCSQHHLLGRTPSRLSLLRVPSFAALRKSLEGALLAQTEAESHQAMTAASSSSAPRFMGRVPLALTPELGFGVQYPQQGTREQADSVLALPPLG